jgi:hypothetical protein
MRGTQVKNYWLVCPFFLVYNSLLNSEKPTMNTRIEQIAQQAEIKFEATLEHSGIDTAVITLADLEKFATLLIRECERVAKDPQWYSESPSNSWRNPIRYVCGVMKEHFGVK